jgi:hypothetical protein
MAALPNDKDLPIPDEEKQATDDELFTSSEPNFTLSKSFVLLQ